MDAVVSELAEGPFDPESDIARHMAAVLAHHKPLASPFLPPFDDQTPKDADGMWARIKRRARAMKDDEPVQKSSEDVAVEWLRISRAVTEEMREFRETGRLPRGPDACMVTSIGRPLLTEEEDGLVLHAILQQACADADEGVFADEDEWDEE